MRRVLVILNVFVSLPSNSEEKRGKKTMKNKNETEASIQYTLVEEAVDADGVRATVGERPRGVARGVANFERPRPDN